MAPVIWIPQFSYIYVYRTSLGNSLYQYLKREISPDLILGNLDFNVILMKYAGTFVKKGGVCMQITSLSDNNYVNNSHLNVLV